MLSDLGSSNGTLVNDVRIDSERLLVPGDMIRIGPILLEVPGDKPTAPVATDAAEDEASVEAASADDIASWLTDDEDEESSGSGTTTIMTTAALAAAESDQSEAADVASDHAIPKSDPNKKKFKSVAEEAAHIIRSWKELIAQDEE